jgi:hypothetical protein
LPPGRGKRTKTPALRVWLRVRGGTSRLAYHLFPKKLATEFAAGGKCTAGGAPVARKNTALYLAKGQDRQGYISDLESGRRKGATAALKKIADVLKVPLFIASFHQPGERLLRVPLPIGLDEEIGGRSCIKREPSSRLRSSVIVKSLGCPKSGSLRSRACPMLPAPTYASALWWINFRHVQF